MTTRSSESKTIRGKGPCFTFFRLGRIFSAVFGYDASHANTFDPLPTGILHKTAQEALFRPNNLLHSLDFPLVLTYFLSDIIVEGFMSDGDHTLKVSSNSVVMKIAKNRLKPYEDLEVVRVRLNSCHDLDFDSPTDIISF